MTIRVGLAARGWIRGKAAFGLSLILSVAGILAGAEQVPTGGRISEPGRYEGYSQALFDGWQRTSQYITMRDGTRIAIDVLRPTNKGSLHQAPLPVIWEHRRYHRAVDGSGRTFCQLDRQDHPLRKVILYGYVVAVADVRGSGASFGTRVDPTPPAETLDAYDITEWLAAQPWCNGQVGMYGISYSGTDQLMAASSCAPHLKAIFPEMAMFDLYDLCYPGGIYRHTLLKGWQQQVRALDMFQAQRPAPVDADKDQGLLSQALRQHQANFDVSRAAQVPLRDAALPEVGRIYMDNSPSTYIEAVNKSNVAVYLRAGWLDMYPRDMLLWFCNLRTPKKIAIGPWDHYQSQGLDRATEMLRWFDYWLKGVENGIMSEPPILYWVVGAPDDAARRWARQWPLPEAKPTRYYLCGGPSRSIQSANDGLLIASPGKPGQDSYVADYTTTSGPASRWTGGQPSYPDMGANDQKALTYTTEPLAQALEIVGHPIAHVWVQCAAPDVDAFVYLEEVDAQGRSAYVTEGCLRASHRATAEAPCAYLGLPYHRHGQQDVKELSNEPAELVFDLLPTARHVAAGHRIRIAVACADKDSYQPMPRDPATAIKVLRDAQHASYVVLPVMSPEGKK
jgi:putative CocE/NonD family hydrolase